MKNGLVPVGLDGARMLVYASGYELSDPRLGTGVRKEQTEVMIFIAAKAMLQALSLIHI